MAAAGPPPPPGQPRIPGIVIATVAVVGLGLVLAALTLALFHGYMMKHKLVNCANNLGQLWKMQQIYSVQFGERKEMSPRTGEDFWLHLAQTDPPLIDREMMEIFQCPTRRRHERCDYRGPAGPVKELGPEDPVGADKQVHSRDRTGNVLFKNADVREVEESDAAWKELDSCLKP